MEDALCMANLKRLLGPVHPELAEASPGPTGVMEEQADDGSVCFQPLPTGGYLHNALETRSRIEKYPPRVVSRPQSRRLDHQVL